MERRTVYMEEIALEELWFDNVHGAIRGGIGFMGVDLIYDPVSKAVVQGNLDGAEWLYSCLTPIEGRNADRVINAVVSTIAFNLKGSVPCSPQSSS